MEQTPDMSMPDMETKEKLDKAAKIVTDHLDQALQECVEGGLERDHFNAAVVATLLQAMETSLGGSAQVAGALHQMAEMAAAAAEREAQEAN
ncbi:hypothetical protein GUA87_04645 [Sneathiella sp. P13V-1]|uniref:hypothetical protein n=1 Tax=Sneathiella sp. P13V-1 TaxID=2697366 RepID=UPI00187B16B6|nr:hypothetical protein [Sneathiella sp. P13V-1]MBE7636121.1 hypothetical protein [Sneathiella sp. P13V-1]